MFDRSKLRTAARSLVARWIAASIALVLCAPGVAEIMKQGVQFPDRTEAGRFHGTWVYVSRDAKIALWLREGESGAPEMKIRYMSLQTPEAFETDWETDAEYYVRGTPATFSVDVAEGDHDVIRGTWDWELQLESFGRTEKGTFVLYRAGDGRNCVMRFERFERVTRNGERVSSRTYDDYFYGFQKVSKRLVLWEELPIS